VEESFCGLFEDTIPADTGRSEENHEKVYLRQSILQAENRPRHIPSTTIPVGVINKSTNFASVILIMKFTELHVL
jgi:hypothetical protein